jgi:hypothetical protein
MRLAIIGCCAIAFVAFGKFAKADIFYSRRRNPTPPLNHGREKRPTVWIDYHISNEATRFLHRDPYKRKGTIAMKHDDELLITPAEASEIRRKFDAALASGDRLTVNTLRRMTDLAYKATAGRVPEGHKAPVAPQDSDLLRMRWVFELSGQEEAAIRGRLLDLIQRSIAEMCTSGIQNVARFIDAIEHSYGSITPAEKLIDDIVRHHYEWGGITPEFLRDQLDPENHDGFEYNFGDAIDIAKRMAATYRTLLTENRAEPTTSGLQQ